MACGGGNEADPKETSLDDQAQERIELITEMEETVAADKARQDVESRQRLLVAYADFANKFNQNSMTPEYLFRAGKLANEMGKSRRAIEYLTNLHDGFPNYEKRTEAAFLVGFIYENMLNDREMAQRAYEKVIEFYPESHWAGEAQASIELLYLTDEQKIAKFKKQNQQEWSSVAQTQFREEK